MVHLSIDIEHYPFHLIYLGVEVRVYAAERLRRDRAVASIVLGD